jgi:hypothetical protein
MRSLLAAAAAVDVALDALSEPAPPEPGFKHRTEALRLLLEARAEMVWALDMWNVAYPDTPATMPSIDATVWVRRKMSTPSTADRPALGSRNPGDCSITA